MRLAHLAYAQRSSIEQLPILEPFILPGETPFPSAGDDENETIPVRDLVDFTIIDADDADRPICLSTLTTQNGGNPEAVGFTQPVLEVEDEEVEDESVDELASELVHVRLGSILFFWMDYDDPCGCAHTADGQNRGTYMMSQGVLHPHDQSVVSPS